MKERPILFTGEMVRAILDGRKTQTRRPLKPQPPYAIGYAPEGREGWCCSAVLGARDLGRGLEWTVGASWGEQPCPQRWLHLLPRLNSPLGTVGDRLWVRETWGVSTGHYDPLCIPVAVRYFADSEVRAVNLSHAHANCFGGSQTFSRKRPSIHMPRWASRITLEITAVRVERLQDISEEDAKAEGAFCGCLTCGDDPCCCNSPKPCFRDGFAGLWQSIHSAESWHANPWVWVYEFRRVKP